MLEHWIRRRSRALFGVCAFTTFILFCLKYVYLGELEIPNGGIAGGPGARTRLLDLPLVPQLPQRVADENMVAYEQMQPETADSERVRFYMTRRSDVMVFLHIQKTGGTVFERHLIKDLDIEHPCVPGPGRKRYKCHRGWSKKEGSWIFSRYSAGWHCGLHADWTELTACVDGAIDRQEGVLLAQHSRTAETQSSIGPRGRSAAGAIQQVAASGLVYAGTTSSAGSSSSSNSQQLLVPLQQQQQLHSLKRRYFYITLLREPRSRFLSEFRHVQRGATWKTSRHICNGRPPTVDELPACYSTPDWMDVTFSEFVSCRSNLAINRMTRMLADLSLVVCYNESAMPRAQRDALLLASAKSNLRKMAFFALCEFQKISQYLFERTFGLRFKQAFVQYNYTRSSLAIAEVSSADLELIDQLNSLDIQLYAFAKELLMERFERAKNHDPDFEQNFNRVMNNKVAL
ncbi:heparan-sulfate 6-O-sulfotransferase 1-like [Varroa jacobsoni]|uniref:heparan-sulfate 6-O-sulfotransferase 1-like n=1 Tax=Varroa jacobsoni TaxID=62625 RepID=UPI000BF7CCD0|nr:heparan-sulfate 6-O-sulfotransferase 1-like [Varroa jacobsoni]